MPFLSYLELDLEMDTLFHATGADFNARTIRDTCPLKIRVDATATGRVKLGGTNRVRVASNNF